MGVTVALPCATDTDYDDVVAVRHGLLFGEGHNAIILVRGDTKEYA